MSELLSDRELALVDAVAARVVQLPDERDRPQSQPSGLVDAAEVARLLHVSTTFVYDHAGELGVIKVGDGDRPRLRFDPQAALESWTSRDVGRQSQAPQPPATAGVHRRRRRAAAQDGEGLLPVRD